MTLVSAAIDYSPSADPLSAEAIQSALPGSLKARFHCLQVHSEIPSTQLHALAATPGSGTCAVFLAERQTQGQGRQGRRWVSPAGCNLYLSVARRFDLPPAQLAGLSLVAGIAIAEALHAAGAGNVKLKWPNDVMVDGRKLGGILIQLRPLSSDASLVAIGIGINVRMPVEAAAQIDQPWCDLAAVLAAPPSRNVIAASVLSHLLPACEAFEAGGMAVFQGRWDALDALLGQRVRILDGAREVQGVAAGVTETGALRVRDGEREQVFHGGEVSVRAS